MRSPHPSRRLLLPLIVAALALAACSDDAPSSDGTGPSGATSSPPGTSAPGTTAPATTTTVVASRSTSVFFVRDGRIAAANRIVPSAGGAEAGLRALLQGPNPREQLAGFSSAIPAGTSVNRLRVEAGTAVVDLTGAFAGGGGSLSMMLRVAQVTHTALQVSGVERVRFELDGVPLTVLGGEGLLLDAPQTRSDLEDVLPRILVESPAHGATVRAPFVARGSSNTFEATHQVQVLGPRGDIVVDTFVTATSGTGTRGTWELQLDVPSTLRGDAVLRVFEASANDGSPLGLVDVPITIV